MGPTLGTRCFSSQGHRDSFLAKGSALVLGAQSYVCDVQCSVWSKMDIETHRPLQAAFGIHGYKHPLYHGWKAYGCFLQHAIHGITCL